MNACPYTVDIVSPQYPCGAAWLANAFLELQVPLGHLWGFETHAEWEESSDGGSLYVAGHLPWRQTLASLHLGRTFQFQRDVRPRFTHAYPWQIHLCDRVVLMVRDPRDALYSEWRRHQRNEGLSESLTFSEFLKQPFYAGPLSIVDMLWLHLRCWIAWQKAFQNRVYLLRFEDWKRAPLRNLRTVSQWLGLARSDDAMTHAAFASDVGHLLSIEKAVEQEGPNARQFNRRGEIDEWRQSWLPAWDEALGSHWQPIFQALGYQPPQSYGSSVPAFYLAEVLRWRGLTDDAQMQAWCKLLGLTEPLT